MRSILLLLLLNAFVSHFTWAQEWNSSFDYSGVGLSFDHEFKNVQNYDFIWFIKPDELYSKVVQTFNEYRSENRGPAQLDYAKQKANEAYRKAKEFFKKGNPGEYRKFLGILLNFLLNPVPGQNRALLAQGSDPSSLKRGFESMLFSSKGAKSRYLKRMSKLDPLSAIVTQMFENLKNLIPVLSFGTDEDVFEVSPIQNKRTGFLGYYSGYKEIQRGVLHIEALLKATGASRVVAGIQKNVSDSVTHYHYSLSAEKLKGVSTADARKYARMVFLLYSTLALNGNYTGGFSSRTFGYTGLLPIQGGNLYYTDRSLARIVEANSELVHIELRHPTGSPRSIMAFIESTMILNDDGSIDMPNTLSMLELRLKNWMQAEMPRVNLNAIKKSSARAVYENFKNSLSELDIDYGNEDTFGSDQRNALIKKFADIAIAKLDSSYGVHQVQELVDDIGNELNMDRDSIPILDKSDSSVMVEVRKTILKTISCLL